MNSIKSYTLIATLISMLLIGLYNWWFQPNILFISIYIVLALSLILSIPLLYRLTGFSAEDDNTWIKLKEKTEYVELSTRLNNISQEMSQLNNKEGIRQTKLLIGILDDYHLVINTRFYGKKYSPMTYLSSARSVQKQAIQNLADVITVTHSLSTIQRNKRKSDELNNTLQQSRYNKQSKMLTEQEARITDLFEDNNQLFNALMETAVEIANMKSFSQFERTDTLSRLIALADIAKQSSP